MRSALLALALAIPAVSQILNPAFNSYQQIDASVSTSASAGLGPATGSNCWNHTVKPGSNRVLFAFGGLFAGGNPVFTATFNGVAMVLINQTSEIDGSTSTNINGFYLVNPAVGTHQVCLTNAVTAAYRMATAFSASGVDQIQPIGSFKGIGSTTTVSAGVTTVLPGDWTLMATYWGDNAGSITGATWHQYQYAVDNINVQSMGMWATGPVSGSQTNTVTYTNAHTAAMIVLDIRHAATQQTISTNHCYSTAVVTQGDWEAVSPNGQYLAVTTDSLHRLQIFNTTPTADGICTLVGSLIDNTNLVNAEGVAWDPSGRYVYVNQAGLSSIAIIDAGTPASPTFVSAFSNANLLQTEGMRISPLNANVMLAIGRTIVAVNITNPTSLSYVNSATGLGSIFAYTLNSTGDVVFGNGAAIGMTIPSASSVTFTTLGTWTSNCSGQWAITWAQNYLYTSCVTPSNALEVVNVTGCTVMAGSCSPAITSTIALSYAPRWSVADNHNLYVVTDMGFTPARIYAYDIHVTPGTPRLLTWWDFTGQNSARCDDLIIASGVMYSGCTLIWALGILP